MNLPLEVSEICDALKRCGYDVALVGGCVRDHLLDRNPNDYDIVTNAPISHIQSLFQSSGMNKNALFINTLDGRVDISSYSDKILDRESFLFHLENDLSNRDFTINSMAVMDEDLLDPTGGFEDIMSMVIYTAGDIEQRLKNDPLRMMRAIRFASTLGGFFIDHELRRAIIDSAHLIEGVAPERVRDELEKIIMAPSKGVYNGLYLLHDFGLMRHILPELDRCFGFEQNSPHHFADVFGHTARVVASCPPDPVVRFSALFHDIGKPDVYTEDSFGCGHFYDHHKVSARIAEKIMERLRFSNEDRDTVKLLVREHMSRFDFLRVKSIKRFINRVGVDNLERLFSLQVADIKSSKEKDYTNILNLKEEVYAVLSKEEPMSIKDLAISGKDLLDMGYEEGVLLGTILREQMEFVLEHPHMNQRDLLLSRVETPYEKESK